jgi:hypothetical protein
MCACVCVSGTITLPQAKGPTQAYISGSLTESALAPLLWDLLCPGLARPLALMVCTWLHTLRGELLLGKVLVAFSHHQGQSAHM